MYQFAIFSRGELYIPLLVGGQGLGRQVGTAHYQVDGLMRMVEQVSFGMQIPFEDPYFQIGQVQQGFKRLRLIEVKVVGSEQSPPNSSLGCFEQGL